MSDFGRNFLRGIGASLNPQASAAIERGRAREANETRFQENLAREDALRKEQFAREDARFKIEDDFKRNKLIDSRKKRLNIDGKNLSILGKMRRELEVAQTRSNESPENIELARQVGFAERGIEKYNTTTALFESTSTREYAKLVSDNRNSASSAKKGIVTANNALRLLDKGVTTGFFANIKTTFSRIAKASGLPYDKNLSNTEQFRSVMGQATLNILGSGVVGAGTGISDKDVEFVQGVVAGDRTLDEETIRRVLQINAIANEYIIENHNDLVSRAKNLSSFRIKPIKYNGARESALTAETTSHTQQQNLPVEGSTVSQNGVLYRVTNGEYIEVQE